MKYETPELTVLTSAIDAIQSGGGIKANEKPWDSPVYQREVIQAYEDWE